MRGAGREVVFVTGGARSGKSRYAQTLAEAWADGGEARLLYIATAEIRDAEMRERVAKHRADRGPRWDSLEEPLDLPRALGRAVAYRGALLDCLTLWTSNLLEAHPSQKALDQAVERFLAALEAFPGRLCVVTNEVGSGIVPANALSRRFRDAAGTINQEVAARATEAHLVVSGLALRLK
jgi:adenosylcobinamide kinase/adenosylcobinamide-phosphate guanylyltransferase